MTDAAVTRALEPFAEVGRWMRENGWGPDDVDFLVRDIRSSTGPFGRMLGHAMVSGADFLAAEAALAAAVEAAAGGKDG